MPTKQPQADGPLGRQVLPAVAVFARAAVPGGCKRRLIPLLGARGAAEFQAALTADALGKISKLKKRAALYFFLAGRLFPSVQSLADFALTPQQGRGLGERVTRAFRCLLRRYPLAVIVGTDAPTMPLRALIQALSELRTCDAVLGPSPDGGYYLFGLRRIVPGLLGGVRWGTAFAFRDTLRGVLERGLSCSILEPVGDVDHPEDLHRLKRRLEADPAARRALPAVWRFLQGWTQRQALSDGRPAGLAVSTRSPADHGPHPWRF